MKNLTPVKAIRAKCLDCCGNQFKEIRLCQIEDCSLYRYRFGKNPNRKKKTNSDLLTCGGGQNV